MNEQGAQNGRAHVTGSAYDGKQAPSGEGVTRLIPLRLHLQHFPAREHGRRRVTNLVNDDHEEPEGIDEVRVPQSHGDQRAQQMVTKTPEQGGGVPDPSHVPRYLRIFSRTRSGLAGLEM